MLSEPRLNSLFSPPSPFRYIKHLIPMTSTPPLLSPPLISSSLIPMLCLLMSPLTFLASATSLSLSTRLAHSFISSMCGSCLCFHHHNSHSPFNLLMNSLACTGHLQLHLGTLLIALPPQKSLSCSFYEHLDLPAH